MQEALQKGAESEFDDLHEKILLFEKTMREWRNKNED